MSSRQYFSYIHDENTFTKDKSCMSNCGSGIWPQIQMFMNKEDCFRKEKIVISIFWEMSLNEEFQTSFKKVQCNHIYLEERVYHEIIVYQLLYSSWKTHRHLFIYKYLVTNIFQKWCNCWWISHKYLSVNVLDSSFIAGGYHINICQ